MRTLILVAILNLFLLPLPVRASGTPLIVVAVGQQRVLEAPGVARVAVGDVRVADVKPLRGAGQILITGVGEGRTSLLVWRGGGRRTEWLVEVRSHDVQMLVDQVQALLGGGATGIALVPAGDRLLLEGEVRDAATLQRVATIASLYPQIINHVRLDPAGQAKAAGQLAQALSQAGLPDVRVSAVGGTLFLEGTVATEAEARKAARVVASAGQPVENLVTVSDPRMILTRVEFLEVRSKSQGQVGIQWPVDVAGAVGAGIDAAGALAGGLPEAAIQVGVTAASAFSLALNQTDGRARFLARPRLVCASGGTARFLAGGQVPIPLLTDDRFTVEYKDYGVRLELQPVAEASGRIRVDLFAEVSDVDESVAVSSGSQVNVPGFRTRNVRTTVAVRPGEAIVLSGVFNHDQQKAVSRIPGLGHLPIIGELFKSRRFQDQESELIILVTPTLVAGGTDQAARERQAVDDRHLVGGIQMTPSPWN